MRIRRRSPGMKVHQGIALLMVILIAALALTGVVAALSLIAPRSSIVKGESASDRALSCADGMIDRLVDQINGFGLGYDAETPSSSDPDQTTALSNVMLVLLEKVNGAVAGGVTDTFQAASARTQTYLINAVTNDIFRLEHGTGTVDTGKFDKVTSLAVDPVYTATGLSGLRQAYPGGDWFEAITNAQYYMLLQTGKKDSWMLTCTSWNVQKPEIRRTVQAEIQKGSVSSGAPIPWYVAIPPVPGQSPTTSYFSDYTFVAGSDIQFAGSSIVTGDVVANGDIDNPGWIKGTTKACVTYARDWNGNIRKDRHGNPVISERHYVYDDNGQGQFGPDGEDLAAAKADGIAVDCAPEAYFPNGDAQIAYAKSNATGSYYVTAANSKDSSNNSSNYSSDHCATIVFEKDGTVTINGSNMPYPSNGLIYVEGVNVKVEGEVNGRVSIMAGPSKPGAVGGNIIVSGNLTYVHDAVTDPQGTFATTPDALGLVAYGNVVLGRDYYESLASQSSRRELDVDAAAMAVHGWIGIDPSCSSHSSGGWFAADPPYTLVWKGSRIFSSFANAPEITRWNSTQGYEVKESYYDYGLKNVGCPPSFPYTSSVDTPGVSGQSGRLQQLVEDTDKDVLASLRTLPVSGLGVVQLGENWYGDSRAYYHVVYEGKDYYRPKTLGSDSSQPASYVASYVPGTDTVYRVSWRESIGTPLQPHD